VASTLKPITGKIVASDRDMADQEAEKVVLSFNAPTGFHCLFSIRFTGSS